MGAAAAAVSLVATPAIASSDAEIKITKRQLKVLTGHRASVSGVLRGGQADREVALEARADGGWKTVAKARTSAGGRFKLRFRPHRQGTQPVRVALGGGVTSAQVGDASPTEASDAVVAATPAVSHTAGRLEVYRASRASTYDGSSPACGHGHVHHGLGVAHKSLPCGTMVTFRHAGHSVTVPVIDRGPFVAGREWDLTNATAHRLHFSGTGTVWSTK
ncbi:MAG TPA: septal ring lytic transglycosylase RlpA family protein [Solirubrobacteraceae bacterium]|nr:septal ring lytic transglycosylase RlpA family protein [Solirubrobacteraceae bacterium]